MPWGFAAAAGMSYLGARQQRKAAQGAAAQQQAGIAEAAEKIQEAAQGAGRTVAPLTQLYQPSLAELLQQQQVYGAAGARGIGGLLGQQQPLQPMQYMAPGAEFQMQQGRQAIEQSAAARGGLLSGATLKSLTQFGQGLAQQNYQQAFENAMRERQQQMALGGQLAGLGGIGTDITSRLFGVGAGAIGTQAQAQTALGEQLAGLSMSSANVGARATAASPSPLLAALQGGLTAYGASAGGGGGAGMGSVDYGAPATGGGSFFSDEEVKKRAKDITDDEIEEFLNSMEGKTYEYKDEVKKQGAPNGRQMGVMAQDMEKSKMGKSIVKTNQDKIKVVDVPQSVSALLASTANLNKRVNKLEGKR